MSTTSIEWAKNADGSPGQTWNPVAGCSLKSPGCTRCYAMRMASRLEAMGQAKYAGLTKKVNGLPVWTGKINLDEAALTIPLRRKKPTTWFVNSMSDLFHDGVPFGFVDRVFAVMALCPQHTFQILTKRPERMAEYLLNSRDMLGLKMDERVMAESRELARGRGQKLMNEAGVLCWPLPSVWLGTSVEDQARADERIPHLLRCPAAVRFLSVEPLLGPTCLGRYVGLPGVSTKDPLGRCANCGLEGAKANEHRYGEFYDGEWACSKRCDQQSGELGCALDHKPVDLVIVGGESGPGARDCRESWIASIVEQCKAAAVPVFVKQLGSCFVRDRDWEGVAHQAKLKDKKGGDIGEFPEDLRVRQMPEAKGWRMPDAGTKAEQLAARLAKKPEPGPSGRRIVWECRLCEMRHKLGLSLRDIEAEAGVSIGVLSTVERGTDPQLMTARKIAEFFGMTVEEMWPRRKEEAAHV